MEKWINPTPRLEQGLKTANQLVNNNGNKFGSLVNHICQKLQSSYEKKIFTKEEEEKLLVSLDLNQENLNILLDTISYIYKQAAYNRIKPSTMETDLKTFNMIDNNTLLLIVKSWTTYEKGIIENFKHLSIYPIQVKDINWSLNIQSSSSGILKDVCPKTLLQLDLTGKTEKKLTVEFEKNDLIELHSNLEKIQNQLDALK